MSTFEEWRDGLKAEDRDQIYQSTLTIWRKQIDGGWIVAHQHEKAEHLQSVPAPNGGIYLRELNYWSNYNENI